MKSKKTSRIRGVIVIGACLILICLALLRPPKMTEPEQSTVHILVSLNNNQGNRERYEKYFQRFNKSQSEIKIIPSYVVSDTHAMLKLIYSKQANQTYDIACMGANQIISLTDMELVIGMDELILKSKGLSWLNQIKPIMLADSMRAGTIYSLPFTRGAMVLYYNQDKITNVKNSITLMDILTEAAKQYDTHKRPKLMVPLEQLLLDMVVQQSIYSTKQKLKLYEKNKVDLLTEYQNAVEKNVIIKFVENGIQSFDKFINGQVDMMVAGSEYLDVIAGQLPFTLGCIPVETYADMTFPLQGNNLYLVNQSDDIKHTEVWNVIDKLLDYGIPKGSFPISNEFGRGSELFRQIFNYDYNSTSGLAVSQSSKIRSLTESMIVNLLQGEGDAKASMQQLQKQVDIILQ